MALEPNKMDEQFVKGQHYKFGPPIETNCVPLSGGGWERKKFPEGLCLLFDETRNAFAFQGRPVGEKIEYYFLVGWGKGSAAENISPPQLRRVK